MAWTAPKNWTVSELVTAANMNTHIRDNLKYLKGQAGAITLEDMVGIGAAPTYGLDILGSTEAESALRISRSDGSTRGLLLVPPSTANAYAKIAVDGGTTVPMTFWTGSTPAERVRITNVGYVGLNRTVPQGILHSYDTVSGLLKWEYDGLDGTARTVIPNGAGDVVYGIHGLFICRASSGLINTGASATGLINGGNPLAPGMTVTMFNNGSDVVQFQAAADGSVTVQRTGGSLTYKVSLLLQWL